MSDFLYRKVSRVKIISFALIIFLTGISVKLNAQYGRGCYVDGVLYTSNTSNGNRFFYRSPGNLTNICGYTPTGNDGNCRLYNSGPIGNNSSYTLYYDSFSNDWTEVICPLDDHVWLLLLSATGFSVLRFRKIIFA